MQSFVAAVSRWCGIRPGLRLMATSLCRDDQEYEVRIEFRVWLHGVEYHDRHHNIYDQLCLLAVACCHSSQQFAVQCSCIRRDKATW